LRHEKTKKGRLKVKKEILSLLLSSLLISLTLTVTYVESKTPKQVDVWCLLVAGSDDLGTESPFEMFRNAYYIYHVLVNHTKVPSNHITFLWKTPVPPSVYVGIPSVVNDSCIRKVDGTFINHVNETIYGWLKENSDSDDIIFMFLCAHGTGYYLGTDASIGNNTIHEGAGIECPPKDEGNETKESTLGHDFNNDNDTDDWVGIDEALKFIYGTGEPPDGKTIYYYDDELKQALGTLQYGRLVVLLQSCVNGATNETCFCGGFIDDLSAPNRIIITSTSETSISVGDPPNLDFDGFSEFCSYFIDCLHGSNTKWRDSYPFIEDVATIPVNESDSNMNGHISVWEAFNYALVHDKAAPIVEQPWYDDDGNGYPTFINETDVLDNDDGALGKMTYLDWLFGDINHDKIVELLDLIVTASVFGTFRNTTDNTYLHNPPCESCPHNSSIADLNIDDMIDLLDLVKVATHFGETWPSSYSSSSSSSMIEVFLGETAGFSVYPSQITTHKHESFSVNVTITNVTDMYGWEFKLYWNNTLLNCTNAQTHAPEIWGNNTFTAGAGIENGYNATHGRYWKALTTLYPAASFNGSTTAVTLTFKALTTGTTTLTLQDTKISDSQANAIIHTTADGSVTVAPRQRFMRGDTHTINGLTAYKLGTTQSSIAKSFSQIQPEYESAYWGIQVWKRSAGGTETPLTSGIVAQVMRASQGQGIQSATWNCPLTSLTSTDTIVVRVYQKIGNYAWQLAGTFTTEQLGATQLDNSTWQVYYYTKLTFSNPKFGEKTTATFYWGTTTYNSNIQNFEYN
jgi:hypothetical protein